MIENDITSSLWLMLFNLILEKLNQKQVGSAGGVRRNPTSVSGAGDFEELIQTASRRYELDPGLLKAVIHQESGFNPNVVSSAGAMGLMQLMPGTAQGLGVTDPFDPGQNIDGGARYLRTQLDRFGSLPLALAAYNAGPGAVNKYQGVPPYAETQQYIRAVSALFERYKEWTA